MFHIVRADDPLAQVLGRPDLSHEAVLDFTAAVRDAGGSGRDLDALCRQDD
jgi:hypothetical protein